MGHTHADRKELSTMHRHLSRALLALPIGAVGLAVAAVAPPSFAATAA